MSSVSHHCLCLIQSIRRRTLMFWKTHWLASTDRNVSHRRRLLCLCFSGLIKSWEMTCCLLRNLHYVLVNSCLTELFSLQVGTLRFCGTTEFASGQWAGIELDEPEGKNNGSVGKVQYFKCAPKRGMRSLIFSYLVSKPEF